MDEDVLYLVVSDGRVLTVEGAPPPEQRYEPGLELLARRLRLDRPIITTDWNRLLMIADQEQIPVLLDDTEAGL